MAEIKFAVADKTKWDALAPTTPTKKEDKYVPILDALEAGEIIQIETSNDKEAKGYRISLGRKSRSRGFSTEYRTDGNTLYVKKSDALITPSKSKAKKEKATASA